MATNELELMTRQLAGATAGQRSTTQCGADELRGLLALITEQIQDADRRHTEVLRQMHERLAVLTQEARNVRAGAPEHSETIARIEGGMVNLAERVAEASANADRRMPDNAPIALRSAAGGRAAETVRPGVDPFDVLDSSLPGDAANPWDAAAAEALAQLHESGATGFAARAADPEMPRVAAPVSAPIADRPAATESAAAEPALLATTMPPVLLAGLPDLDKGWLEAQIAQLAQRLEQSMAEARPDGSVQALGERFNEFEERLALAFDGVATRTDVEGLGVIEAHIVELSSHVEAAQVQLARLEAIEMQLQSVTDQLSDERLALLSPAPQPASTPAELQRIAATAAEEAASRVRSLVAQMPMDGGVPELRAMLDRFMDERRTGDVHMTSMLDTMQQALIRVLDRMDAMEMAQLRAAAPQIQAVAAPVPVPQPTITAQAAVHARIEPQLEAPGKPHPIAESALDVDAEGTKSIERLRRDFKADVQRAKQKAALDASEAAASPAAAVATVASATAAAGSSKVAQAKPATTKAAAEAPASGSFLARRKGLVGAALATVVAVTGIMLLMPSGKRKAPKPAAITTEQPAKSKPKSLPAAEQAAGPQGTALEAGTADAPAVPPGLKSDGNPAAAPLLPATPQAPAAQAPTGAPQAPAVPAAPETPQTRRSVPETGIDDLGFGDEIPEASRTGKSTAEASGGIPGPLGVTLTSPLNAPLAGNLVSTGEEAPVAPASLSPSAGDVRTGTRMSALDLPPATVGPLSLRLAAAKGDPSAEFEVGARLAEGKGTSQNFKEAIRWYQRSATRGFAQAQYRLGTLYERGLGAPADMGRAKVWYQRAAEQGNMKAMHNLAVLAAGRETGTPDYATAARWFREAAERNLADSQFNYAVLLESGLGAQKDWKGALKWFSLAAKGGDREAVRRRDELRAKLAPGDAAEADALAAAFAPMPTQPIVNDARVAGEDWKKRAGNG